MYKQKISPEKSLEFIKLRMGYDLKKTLNENKKILVEQDAKTDAGIIHKELHDSFTDEKKIVAAIVNKYKNWDEFKGLLQSYKDQFGVKMGADFSRGFTQSSDKKEWTELSNYLKGIGVEMNSTKDDKGRNFVKFRAVAVTTGGDNELKNYPPCVQSLNVQPDPDDDGNYSVTDPSNNWWYFKNCTVSVAAGKMQPYACNGNTIVVMKVGDPKAGCKAKSSGGGGNSGGGNSGGKVAPKIPAELKNEAGVKAFQDWLDKEEPNWATGYKDGKINQGKNGGGYGKFGPRTSKAWNKRANDYIKFLASGNNNSNQNNSQESEEFDYVYGEDFDTIIKNN